MGLCFAIPVEDEPVPRRFIHEEVSPNRICIECKKEGSEVFFHRIHPFGHFIPKPRRNAIVCPGRCPNGHEYEQKIERGYTTKKIVSKS
jgi:hypothetical protein